MTDVERCWTCRARGAASSRPLCCSAYLLTRPNSVLLLDEPDAHLEILRQRQIYQLLTDVAGSQNSQLIAASHSEILLNEAADRDVVIAFVGKPHRIDDRGSQLAKALKEIGFEHYYLAEETGWVLYLEGSTDLAILRAFAERLGHPAAKLLDRPFVHYVANQPPKAELHFFGLREAVPGLVGLAVYDRLDREAGGRGSLQVLSWPRREIENYLCQPQTLTAYAEELGAALSGGPLFERIEKARYRDAMEACIADLMPPVALRDPTYPWWTDVKASDEFLTPLFEMFFKRLSQPNIMAKTNFHRLAHAVPVGLISPDVARVLDTVVATARDARPPPDPDDG